MNLVFFAISLLLSHNIYPSWWPECSSFKTVLHVQYFRDAWMKSSFFYPALGRKTLRRLERMCAGVSGLWWLWSKEATSASSIWRLSWRHCWRGLSRSTHQVVSPHPLARQRSSARLITIPAFSSAETGLEQRHMAFCGLFSDTLALLNGVGVSTGEALVARVITWLDRKGRGFPILPLLTACSRCLASVRHMTRIMEACITAYFNHGNWSWWFLMGSSV